jgi:hypothetical protein
VAWAQTTDDATSPPKTGGSLTGNKVEVNPNGYTSARICGRCHVDIYESWKNSLHAFSLTDPIFDTAYMQALKEVGDEAKRFCLGCHAPMTLINGDYDLEEGVTREGVSCDFCHTVTEVHMGDLERPYSIDLGIVKRGIIKKAGSPAHETAYSELHGKSEFCGACHNYVTPAGTPIMTTYDEWKRGPYSAEGVQCQDCHMALGEGTVVSEDIKKTGPEFHLHSLIHDTDQLQSALSVKILKTQRAESELQVQVQVENVGSGHKVPTGMPSREVVLTVTTSFGGRSRYQERRYARVLGDEKGRSLSHDFEALLHGAMVLSDNRIGPREQRIESFKFPVPRSGSVKVTATVTYVYSPPVLDRRQLEVNMASEEKVVR